MRQRTFSETAVTKPGGTGEPVTIHHRLHYTRDGVVSGWTTLHHRPVAIVDQRSTAMHEADSFVGFLKWGEPAVTSGPTSWIRGARPIGYSFNWLYVGTRHIAYVVSGRDPRRDPHADPNLPTWGTGVAKWRGILPASRHPHQIDPKSGFFTSWNNKPAPAFSASDDMYGWGPVHRVQLINRQLRHQQAKHPSLTRANLVTAVEEAATQDLTAVSVIPPLLHYLGSPANRHVRRITHQLAAWVRAGSHRRTARATDHQYAHHAAIAIWDQAYPSVIRALFDALFAKGGVSRFDGLPSAYRVLPMEFALTPNGDATHHGDGYYVGWEGYVVTALRQLAGKPVTNPFPPAVLHRMCGRPSRCRKAVRHALRRTFHQLTAINGTAHIARWSHDAATQHTNSSMPAYDRIIFQAVGIVGQPDIAWQNRPTYQQVVEFR
jgi:acyl-homoserine lactone acylase PvdQ